MRGRRSPRQSDRRARAYRALARYALPVALLATSAAPARGQTFDHSAFDALLKAHVVKGMVDYDAFKGSTEFGQYLGSLARFNPRTLPHDDQLAFWINAYNAYTIQLIIQHGERKSIRNINKTHFLKANGPWREKLAVVGDTVYGLDQIEQGIIRREFKEPRIHFALVCAAIGCPPLRSEAYSGAHLDEQLTDQGRIFLLDSPAKNRVDAARRTVYVSQVFKFHDYEKDFGGSQEAVARFIAGWYPEGPEKQLLASGKWDRFDYTDYDWTLNSQENTRAMKGGATK
ncbi:MAG: DUF547 domain-containing protein [Gemmatimonadales bacterium]